MPVITMTREMATWGNRVAVEVAMRLGLELRYAELVASEAERESRVGTAVCHFVDEAHPGSPTAEEPQARLMTAAEIYERAMRGDVLLRGWGPTHLLRDVAHVISVRVTAPIPVRVERLLERVPRLDRAAAARELEASDRHHGLVIQRNFGHAEWRDLDRYDVVLNTGMLSLDDCVSTIVALTRQPHFRETDASRQQLADAHLGARVHAAFVRSQFAGEGRIGITAREGRITLTGVLQSAARAEQLAAWVSRLPGVRGVDNEVHGMQRDCANG